MGQNILPFGSRVADLHHVAAHGDVEFRQEPARYRAGSHAGRCLTGTRSLEDVTRIAAIVLQKTHQVRVPRPGKPYAPQRLIVGLGPDPDPDADDLPVTTYSFAPDEASR